MPKQLIIQLYCYGWTVTGPTRNNHNFKTLAAHCFSYREFVRLKITLFQCGCVWRGFDVVISKGITYLMCVIAFGFFAFSFRPSN